MHLRNLSQFVSICFMVLTAGSILLYSPSAAWAISCAAGQTGYDQPRRYAFCAPSDWQVDITKKKLTSSYQETLAYAVNRSLSEDEPTRDGDVIMIVSAAKLEDQTFKQWVRAFAMDEGLTDYLAFRTGQKYFAGRHMATAHVPLYLEQPVEGGTGTWKRARNYFVKEGDRVYYVSIHHFGHDLSDNWDAAKELVASISLQ